MSRSRLTAIIPRITLCAAVCAAAGLVTLPRTADAQWAVVDAPLNQQFQLYSAYMRTGLGSTPVSNGVIELLGAAGQKLDNINEFNRQYFQLLKQSQVSTAAEAIQMQRNIADNAQAIQAASGGSPLSCSAMGGGEAGAAGGTAATATAAAVVKNLDITRTQNHTDTANLADHLANVQLWCDANDVLNHRPGCARAGTYPNADIDASSIFRGVQPDGTIYTANQTLATPQQQAAAMAYINNLLPLPSPQPQGSAANTIAGKKALVDMRTYNARVGSAVNALAAISGSRNAVASIPNEFGGSASWADASKDYSTVFPGQVAPKNPSAREMLSYFVLRTLYSPDYYAKFVANASGDDLTRELIKQVAYNNQIQLLVLSRTEEANTMLATLVAQSVDPKTRASIASEIPPGSLQQSSVKQ